MPWMFCPRCVRSYYNNGDFLNPSHCIHCNELYLEKWEGCDTCIYFNKGYGPYFSYCDIDANKCKCYFHTISLDEKKTKSNILSTHRKICKNCIHCETYRVHNLENGLCNLYNIPVKKLNYCKDGFKKRKN